MLNYARQFSSKDSNIILHENSLFLWTDPERDFLKF